MIEDDDLVLDFSGNQGPQFVQSSVQTPDIVDESIVVESATREFSTLLGLVTRGNLGAAMEANREALTVFAPTNEAFEEAFRPGELENLSDEKLAELLARHVIFGRITSETLATSSVCIIEIERGARATVFRIFFNVQILQNFFIF